MTILVPVYNEELTIPLFLRAITEVVSPLSGYHFTLLFIDDGSSDNTLSLIKEASQSSWPFDITYRALSRNFGQEIAHKAGLDAAVCDAIIIMDVDLQDPPSLIPQMLEKWQEGYDDVYAKRTSRAGETWLKKLTAYLYYRVFAAVTPFPTIKDAGDFRLLSAKALRAMQSLPEHDRCTKGMFNFIGFKKIGIPYKRALRAAGTTKWKYRKLFKLAFDSIFSFSAAPLTFITWTGWALTFVAFLYLAYSIAEHFIRETDPRGYTTLLSFIVFFSGLQIVIIGVLGQYIGRIATETKRRPLYFIQEESPELTPADSQSEKT